MFKKIFQKELNFTKAKYQLLMSSFEIIFIKKKNLKILLILILTIHRTIKKWSKIVQRWHLGLNA